MQPSDGTEGASKERERPGQSQAPGSLSEGEGPVVIVHSNIAPYFQARIRAAAALGDVVAVPRFDPGTGYASTRPILTENESAARMRCQIAERVPKLLNELHPTVVVLQSWVRQSALVALSWAVSHEVPVVMMGDFQTVERSSSVLTDAIKRRLFRHCGAFLVAGTAHRDYLIAQGVPENRIRIGFDVVDNDHFGNGADVARANATSLRQRLHLPERYFLAVSRLEQEKNLDTLLQAYATYCRTCPGDPWHLVIVGDGSLRGSLASTAARFDVASQVHFFGHRDYETLPALYGLASVFVHTATYEPWGLVVNEAMAAGLPVLVSKLASCAADLVHTDNGGTFDPRNMQELTARLVEVTVGKHDLAAMARQSRARIAEFSLDVFADQFWKAVHHAKTQPTARGNYLDRSCLSWISKHAPAGT